MWRSKHLVGMLLLAMLMITVVPFSAMVYAQNQDEKFKEIAEQAKEKVDELGAHIGDTLGITWPDDFPEDIQTAYSDASSDFAAGDYKDAMKAYREVFKMLNIYAEAQGVVLEGSGGEEAQGLFVAIDRARERIARIEDVRERIPATGETATFLSWVDANLTEAETNLSDAEDSLEPEPPNIEWAVGNLTEARKNISEAFAALRLIGGWTSFWRVESFLMGIRKSVDRTRELLDRAKNQGLGVYELEAQLEDVEDLIDAAGELREAGEIRYAIEELRAAREILRNIHQELAELRKGGPGG